MDRDQRVATLRREAAAIAHTAHQGTAAEVPNCPGWTVADLLAHLTNLYRGVAELVRTTAEEGRDHWPPKQFIDRTDPSLIEQFEACAWELEAVLAPLRPDKPVWSFTRDRTAGFWQRRMAVETSVHRSDIATGAIDPAVARDGVDELLELFARGLRRASQVPATGERYHFHRTDGDGEWFVELEPGEERGVNVRREHAKGDVAIRGTAEDLLLFLWHRPVVERLDVHGDTSLLDRWFVLLPPM